MDQILEKWKEIVESANAKGIPIPMIKVDGQASLSATFAFISFNIWIVSVIGKAAGALGGMDPSACLQMFLACAGLYWGRKIGQSKEGKITIEGKEDKEPKNEA